MEGTNAHPQVWAEVDLSAIAHNTRELRRLVRSQTRLLAVVKANAYGHGAVPAARTALESGAQTLGVARPAEGIELREAGISAPVLIFGYSEPKIADTLLEYSLVPTVWSLAYGESLSAAAKQLGKTIDIHVKIDTGMGRLGIVPDCLQAGSADINSLEKSISELREIAGLPGLSLAGLYTHFAEADTGDEEGVAGQLRLFSAFIDRLRDAGISVPLCHAANSAAIIDMPATHLDMVRAGIALYGLYPSEAAKKRVRLKPAMALKTRVVQLKSVGKGFKVSYGGTHQTSRPTTIATLPIGYADGLNRRLSSRGQVIVNGCRVPIIGRVCMDLTMVDVGNVPGIAEGDEVVVFGRQGDEEISADEVAGWLNTINYEIVSTVSDRVPRVHV